MPTSPPSCSRDELIQSFREIFAESSNIVNLLSVESGKIVLMNRAGLEAFGHEEVKLVSKPLMEFCQPKDHINIVSSLKSLKESGSSQFRTQLISGNGDHRELWIRCLLVMRIPELIALVHTEDVTEEERRQSQMLEQTKRFLKAIAAPSTYEAELNQFYRNIGFDAESQNGRDLPNQEALGISINPEFLVMRGPDNQDVSLTPTELKMLSLFKQASDLTVVKGEITKRIWGDSQMGQNTFNVHLFRLRKKLARSGYEIVNLNGDQYRLKKIDET